MLLSLARWILRGPLTASLAAALLAVIPGFGWASGTVVALVGLRKQLSDTLLPLLAALIVASLVHWPMGDVSQVALVLGAWMGGLVLASSRQLERALLVSVGVSAAVVLVSLSSDPGLLSRLQEIYEPVLQLWGEAMVQRGHGELWDSIDMGQLLAEGMVLVAVSSTLSALLIARWLQARLFNPGGFQQEFHQLRLTPPIVVIVVACTLLTQVSPDIRLAMPGLLLLFVLAGVALVHGLLGGRPGNGPLLAVFYAGLIFSAGLGIGLLMLAALLDSFIDFRKRIQKR